jgi:ABC-2 type transport system ATP-binding protein
VEPAVSVENLSQVFKARKVLDNIEFQVNEGEFFIITGPSGSGKTTLISILAGIQAYKSGSVKIFGYQVAKGKEKHKPYIGLVTQEPSLFNNFTVKENLMVLGMMRGMPAKYLNERISWAIESFQLESLFSAKLRYLSEGEKKRVALAGALLGFGLCARYQFQIDFWVRYVR